MTMDEIKRVAPGRYENSDFVILCYSKAPTFWGLLRKTPVGLRYIAGFSLLTNAKRHIDKIYKAICEMEA